MMSCCPPAPSAVSLDHPDPPGNALEEFKLASRPVGGGVFQTEISVPSIHCGGCINRIERGLAKLAGVQRVRVNLTNKRVSLRWAGKVAPDAIMALKKLGYEGYLFDNNAATGTDRELPGMIKALAVAAFASMNIMSLSTSVWSGADEFTRAMLHWICAGIALPALLYSGRIFYLSAWRGLKHWQTNMDVPISIGVIMAFALSVYDTYHGYEHAYFDAATSLVFFLLIGRTLDHVMRERTRSAVKGLAILSPRGALVISPEGRQEYLPLQRIKSGMNLLLLPGERVPVDCTVIDGVSDVDCSLVTGENAPRQVQPGSNLQAGTLNITGSIKTEASAAAGDFFLAEMSRLIEAAESAKSHYQRIADRAARYYAPAVHTASLLSFIGWMLFRGDVHESATVAIAVLIITCPCALGLAVPMVQVMAARRLFENRVMVKDGSALERLNEIDTVVFDKTGTLTLGQMQVTNAGTIDPATLSLAGKLASNSRHPNALAIVDAALALTDTAPRFEQVREYPGLGIEGVLQGRVYRLGRASFACPHELARLSDTTFACEGSKLASFALSDTVRPGARGLIENLLGSGIAVEVMSGDNQQAVHDIALQLNIPRYTAEMLPEDKVVRIETLTKAGAEF